MVHKKKGAVTPPKKKKGALRGEMTACDSIWHDYLLVKGVG